MSVYFSEAALFNPIYWLKGSMTNRLYFYKVNVRSSKHSAIVRLKISQQMLYYRAKRRWRSERLCKKNIARIYLYCQGTSSRITTVSVSSRVGRQLLRIQWRIQNFFNRGSDPFSPCLLPSHFLFLTLPSCCLPSQYLASKRLSLIQLGNLGEGNAVNSFNDRILYIPVA